MKNLGYRFLKNWIKVGLYCYYSSITISGKENIPKNKPVMFLPNHQNALLDVLLVGVDCNRKPWFLTRSDVFKRPRIKKFFSYLQMIPIYRIRDGRDSLKNNDAVFKRCVSLLAKNEAILMFPEANHNLERRVRPLSKGFTRILFTTLERFPDLDIQLVPVGLNYKDAEAFPDRVAIYFGRPISVKELYQKEDVHASTLLVKSAVSQSLKSLTTHVQDTENYEQIIAKLDAYGADYLKPTQVNKLLKSVDFQKENIENRTHKNLFAAFAKFMFTLINAPLILGWRYALKPIVWEPEFTGTLRFAYALITSLCYYFGVFALVAFVFSPAVGLYLVLFLIAFNWFYVKLN